jgi:hypothetical protein
LYGAFSFSFSIFDVRSYVSYQDLYNGKFKDYREGVGFSVFYLFIFFSLLERGSHIWFGVFEIKVPAFLGVL